MNCDIKNSNCFLLLGLNAKNLLPNDDGVGR